tara:strand:- start:43 stop:699 length:657 start_codon:yes stop_codon:yes gene_type:complete
MAKKKWVNLFNYSPSKEAAMGMKLIDDVRVEDLPEGKVGEFSKSGDKKWITFHPDYQDNPQVLNHEFEHAYWDDQGIGGSSKPSPYLDALNKMLKTGNQRVMSRGVGAENIVIGPNKKPMAVNRNPDWLRTEVDPRVDSDQHLLTYNRPLDETKEYQLPKFRFNETLRNDKLQPILFQGDAFGPKDLGSPFLRFKAEELRGELSRKKKKKKKKEKERK